MELGLPNTLLPGDPRLVDHIVGEVKSQGIFDQFRKECIADVDTKPAYQNLRTRVEGSVNSFLSKQSWKPDLNKNQLRETLRKHIHEAPYLDAGVERIVDQVVNPKVYSVFMHQIEDVVYKFLGIERPKAKEKNGLCGLKDLLPKDLDPVSPESDKNSLKDVSLESMDAMEDLEIKKDIKFNEQKSLDEEISNEKGKDSISENGQVSSEEKALDESDKIFNKTGSILNLNTSGKSDDKTEEDEEDSPTFEPIDIMNLNESNNSNDSHLSGISELTSHRSRSPDFCNELSRDNFDYSNQDSQLSKVSSDSRLSIVTDFGSSNHASTPIHDPLKDEVNKDRYDVKNIKDNFKAIREYESSKNKSNKNIFELNKNKDVQDVKDSKTIKNNLSSKENSRDATDSSIKDRYEHKNNKDKSRDHESKSKSKDKNHVKDGKHHRDRSSDKKKERSHSSSKYDKYDKNKPKDKNDQPKETIDKIKDTEKDNYNKTKEDKIRETDKKDNISKEGKDLKDLYKEKIRELREKKELTEKEKLNKDNKESKSNKENKDKKDSPKDKKLYKKDHKTSSKNSSSSSHEVKTIKASEKVIDGKEKRNESKDRDKNKRDERRTSKDHMKSKNHISMKSDPPEKLDKQDVKKFIKSEKEEKIDKPEVRKDVKSNNEKINGKKDTKNHTQSKSSTRNEKLDSKKDNKSDSQHKDKRRREEKKSKSKDDHSSLRRNSNDRRSTDRDGSNGSSSKSSQSSNSGSNIANNKSNTSTFSKETNHMSNSGSETSDNVEESHPSDLKLSFEQQSYKLDKTTELHTEYKTDNTNNHEIHIKQELEFNDINLPLKKRALLEEDYISGEMKVKKPKFAKNIHEAKKLMKIRKQIEKQKLKENKKLEKKLSEKIEQPIQTNTINNDNVESMPDEERVQIIEIPDEEYEEPYPEKYTNLTLEERSIMMLQTEAGAKDLLETHSNLKLKLSDMELCIKKSLSETLPNKIEKESIQPLSSNIQKTLSSKKGVENSQNKELSSSIEEADNNMIKAEEIDHSVDIYFKKEMQQETSVSKIKIHVVPQEPNHFSIDSNKKDVSEKKEQLQLSNINTHNMTCSNNNKSIEIPTTSKFRDQDVSQDAQNSSLSNVNSCIINRDCIIKSKEQPEAIESTSMETEDNEDCRYFKADNEKSEKFSSFLESLELIENSSLEDIIESLGGQVVSSVPKAMAPPLPKRKHSSSPLTDILLNNSNNNNDSQKGLSLPNEEALSNIKKRKLVPKKQRLQPNICAPQGLLNGENFVMPLSPESDVSATSEKIPSSNLIKEDKGRHRSSQRYSSDDLYKPRPLFSSSSRRSRRSNQV
ncbi:biorientation of chromosomes in cell division protein 1-like 1 isoform X1 [Bombus vosnesenskii]|uniref:Biorientation of chromosomes in cell division protein 1-like 1 isoform X1 n=1 Tax=Bombus vosnesenskii TaxID=207650 RepID=A0A6J3LCA7_9HYME|nr:biorientation of chromosomes in cell division protein 1-like 1 isoform X1 [Bombus vosnesenskii]